MANKIFKTISESEDASFNLSKDIDESSIKRTYKIFSRYSAIDKNALLLNRIYLMIGKH